ncbi:hypothetical protein ACHAWF_007344 [Thalassiosira exigua]
MEGDLTLPIGGATNERVSSKPNRNSARQFNSLLPYATTTPLHDEHGECEQGDGERKRCCSKFCLLLDVWPTTFVCIAALIGTVIGIGLSFWTPDNPSAKETLLLWIGLLGDVFIRSLRCIIIPLVFVSVTIAVMDMMALGAAGNIAGTTIGLYLCTTVAGAIIGCMSSVIFSGTYDLQSNGSEDTEGPSVADVRLGCQVDENGMTASYLTETEEGSVVCMDKSLLESNGSALFRMEDVNQHFATADDIEGPAKLTLSESIYQGLFMQLFYDNMIGIFTNSNFLGVIVLATGFGVALARLSKKMPADVNWDKILIVQILEELMEIFMMFIIWIIKCTPFAIMSLIAKAFGANSDIGQAFEQLGYYIAAVAVGIVLQVVVVYGGLYALFVRSSPLSYFKHMFPAQMMAFASDSSAATLPISIDCAISSGKVVPGVAHFCLPLGATINMDGAAIQIINSVIWLAYQNGVVPTAANYIVLAISATFGSMGAAPVPAAGIVLIITAYTTTFGEPAGGTLVGLPLIIAVDWIVARIATVANVTGDLTIPAAVALRAEWF